MRGLYFSKGGVSPAEVYRLLEKWSPTYLERKSLTCCHSLLEKVSHLYKGLQFSKFLQNIPDQLNVQLPVNDESAKEFADAQQHQGIGRSPAAKLSVVDLNSEQQVTLRTVNVPKGPEGLGLSIKVGN